VEKINRGVRLTTKTQNYKKPVVGMAVLRAKNNLTNEAAEKRLMAE